MTLVSKGWFACNCSWRYCFVDTSPFSMLPFSFIIGLSFFILFHYSFYAFTGPLLSIFPFFFSSLSFFSVLLFPCLLFVFRSKQSFHHWSCRRVVQDCLRLRWVVLLVRSRCICRSVANILFSTRTVFRWCVTWMTSVSFMINSLRSSCCRLLAHVCDARIIEDGRVRLGLNLSGLIQTRHLYAAPSSAFTGHAW